jgi:hypothetical protein
VLQKIEYICGSVSLDDQEHSPRPRGEDLLRQLYACDGLQYEIQHLEAWNEEKENLHTKSYKAKFKRLRSTRLTCRDQEVKLLDMQKLQVINDT